MVAQRFTKVVQSASLILGPALMGVSTFFWTAEGRQGVTGGTLTVLGSAVWLYGLLGAWELVRGRRPVLGVLGGLLAIAGAVGGMAFGLQGFFEAAFGLTKEQSLAALDPHPIAATLLLWVPGPAFPAAIAVLGIALRLTRIGPTWVAVLLIAAGVLFPLSRIPRIDTYAHAVDLLLFVSSTGLAVWLARKPVP